MLGKLPALPLGRRVSRVGDLERRGERQVHEVHAEGRVAARWKLRVEARVRAARAVVELAVQEQLRVRKDIFCKNRLAPADLRADEIGLQALVAQLRQPL